MCKHTGFFIVVRPNESNIKKINYTMMLLRFNAPSKVYYSINIVLNIKVAVYYPTEFLNYFTPPGIPPHKLILNVGSPIIIYHSGTYVHQNYATAQVCK